ncbi:hypothetical protein BMF35_a1197 [Aurantiacibacter gangjinensis]|nr:hypothetical protein BMF35_a1197 [Aurantiacibacter gangjinensis]
MCIGVYIGGKAAGVNLPVRVSEKKCSLSELLVRRSIAALQQF